MVMTKWARDIRQPKIASKRSLWRGDGWIWILGRISRMEKYKSKVRIQQIENRNDLNVWASER